MYPFHPFTVHFPVALFLANGLLTTLYLCYQRQSLDNSAYHCLVIGWWGALIAITTGIYDAARQLIGPDAQHDNLVLGWVNAHAFIGIVTLIVYGQALQRRRHDANLLNDTHKRRGYLRLLVIGTLLTLINGWVGGHLVYSLQLGVNV